MMSALVQHLATDDLRLHVSDQASNAAPHCAQAKDLDTLADQRQHLLSSSV